jgi:hypothetical protein
MNTPIIVIKKTDAQTRNRLVDDLLGMGIDPAVIRHE